MSLGIPLDITGRVKRSIEADGLILTLRTALILCRSCPHGGLEAQGDPVDFSIARSSCM